MNAENLVNGKVLLKLVDRLSVDGYDGNWELIRRTPVRDAIMGQHCKISPAELAEILKGKAWVLEELKKSLIYRTSDSLDRGFDGGYNQAIKLISDTIQALESQAPVSPELKVEPKAKEEKP